MDPRYQEHSVNSKLFFDCWFPKAEPSASLPPSRHPAVSSPHPAQRFAPILVSALRGGDLFRMRPLNDRALQDIDGAPFAPGQYALGTHDLGHGPDTMLILPRCASAAPEDRSLKGHRPPPRIRRRSGVTNLCSRMAVLIMLLGKYSSNLSQGR
jgi:hypothetical protein